MNSIIPIAPGIYELDIDDYLGEQGYISSSGLKRVLEKPFISRWIFDVEVIARFLVLRQDGSRPPVRSIIVEKPLLRWRDVEGSKLRPRHFVIVMGDFVRIYSRYLRRVDMR